MGPPREEGEIPSECLEKKVESRFLTGPPDFVWSPSFVSGTFCGWKASYCERRRKPVGFGSLERHRFDLL